MKNLSYSEGIQLVTKSIKPKISFGATTVASRRNKFNSLPTNTSVPPPKKLIAKEKKKPLEKSPGKKSVKKHATESTAQKPIVVNFEVDITPLLKKLSAAEKKN